MKLKLHNCDYQVNFKHYYVPERKGKKVEVHPKATRCTITISFEMDGYHFPSKYHGYSICNPDDQFSKEMGRFQSLINCLKYNGFLDSTKKSLITQYLLEFKYAKLESFLCNYVKRHWGNQKYIVWQKSNTNEKIYDDFIVIRDYESKQLDQYTNHLLFIVGKNDPNQFTRECILQLIDNKYKQYYS